MDTAVRVVSYYHHARGNPDKTDIVARENSYHGSTYLTQSVGKRNGDRIEEFRYKTDGIHHLSCPNPYAPPRLDERGAVLRPPDRGIRGADCKGRCADRIGGFIAEPIQASGGIIIPPEGYLRRMWEVCQRHDILFIADEVVTAFGRIGHWFASLSEFGVQPDMITSAKGLTSGYLPLGALILSDRIWAAMATGGHRWFTTGLTYSGHPVSCAAGLKNIEIMEREGLLENATKVGTYFQSRLKALETLPLVGNVRGKGLMLCVESVANQTTKELLPDWVNESKRISNVAESLGLIVRPIGHLNVMSPPLIITESDVDFIAETLETAIRRVTDDLTREGIRLG